MGMGRRWFYVGIWTLMMSTEGLKYKQDYNKSRLEVGGTGKMPTGTSAVQCKCRRVSRRYVNFSVRKGGW